MLKITARNEAGITTFDLEGKLAGPWVAELGRCWRESPGSVSVRLRAVSFVDAEGKALLAAMHRQGVKLEASECMTKALVAEITGARNDCRGLEERQ